MSLKFSDYFCAPGLHRLALIIGALAGFPAGIFFGARMGVVTFAVLALLISLTLPVSIWFEDAPYRKMKEELHQPFLLDERVQFTVRTGKTVIGFLVLTENSLIFLTREDGLHRLELSREDVKSIVLSDPSSFRVFLDNTQFIRVISGASEEMLDILRRNGWN